MAFADRVPIQDFTLASNEAGGANAPYGIWSDGTTMWVADSGDDELYAYNLATTARDSSKDFDTLSEAGNGSPYGIWSDGTTMWVANAVSGDNKLYAYNLATTARDSSKDFDTLSEAGNNSPYGIWSDGTTMWVADNGDDKLYAYTLATKVRDSTKDFDTLSAAGNNTPFGLWSDGTTMWVADFSDDKLFAYNLATTARDSSKDFDTLSEAGNGSPYGIWSDGTTMWVADDTDDKLYAYELASNTAPTVTMAAPTTPVDGSATQTVSGTFSDDQGNDTATITIAATLGTLGAVTKDDTAGTWEAEYTAPASTASEQTDTVTVTATDDGALTDTASRNVTIRAIQAPDEPNAPSVTSTGTTSISATFSAAGTGDAADTLDLRWREGTTGDWTEVIGVTSPRSITGLTEGTLHQVAVRGVNAAGNGAWSDPPGSATTDSADLMPTLGVVSDSEVEQGTALSRTLPAATGGDQPVTYTVTGRPTDMGFDATTRELTWPAQSARSSHTLTYTATDTDGDVSTQMFTVRALLGLGDFDTSLEVELLLFATSGVKINNRTIWTEGSRGILHAGSDVAYDNDSTTVREFRVVDSEDNICFIRGTGSTNLGPFFLPGGAGNDLTVYMFSQENEASWTVAGSVRGGDGWVCFDTPAADIAWTEALNDGDRFIVALARVPAVLALAATADAEIEVDLAGAAPATLGDVPEQPPLAATANASFEVDFSADAPATIVVSAALTGLSLFDFENLPDGLLAWFAETDPYSQTNVGARVVDEGGESTQALSPIVPEFVVGGGNAYVVTLLFFFDGQLWLELHTSPTSSGSGSGPQLTDYAEANFVLAIETDTGNTYSWRVGDLILSDDSEPYRWSASSVATAGPALTDAIRTGIINSSSVKSILFDSTSSQIDAANLRTNTTSPLAATADTSFEVEFSAAAPASLGSAPEALSFSDWATYAPAGREARLLMLALRGTTHWYWPAQDSSGQLLDTSNSLYDDDLTDDLTVNRIRWVDGDFTLNRSGAGSFDTYFEGATPPLDDGIWHIITDDGEITLGSALLDDAGGGFARWMPTDSADIAFLDGIAAGDRFLLAFTMPGTPVTALAATADASFEVDLAAAAPATLGAAPVHTPLAATANADLEINLAATGPATLGDAPTSPPLAATADADLEINLAADAPASRGEAGALAATADASFEVRLAAAGQPTLEDPPTILAGEDLATNLDEFFAVTLQVGNAGDTYTATNLPPGLTFNTSSRLISGTPTRAGAWMVTYTITGSGGAETVDKFLIGVHPAGEPNYALLVDWDGDGSFSHPLTDAFGDLTKGGVRTSRGRNYASMIYGRSVAGTLEATVVNYTGTYDRFATSDLAGLLLPRRRIIFVLATDSVLSRLWTGFLDEVTKVERTGGNDEVRIRATDTLGDLLREDVGVAYMENTTVADAVAAVLDASGIAAEDRGDISGPTPLAIYFAADAKALLHLRQLEETEAGFLYVQADGRVVFESVNTRYAADPQPDGAGGDHGRGELRG